MEKAGWNMVKLLRAANKGNERKIEKLMLSDPFRDRDTSGRIWTELLSIKEIIKIEDLKKEKKEETTHPFPFLRVAVIKGEYLHGEPWIKSVLLLQVEPNEVGSFNDISKVVHHPIESYNKIYKIVPLPKEEQRKEKAVVMFQYPVDLEVIHNALQEFVKNGGENKSKGWALLPLAAINYEDGRLQDSIDYLKKACSLPSYDSYLKDEVKKFIYFQEIIKDSHHRKELAACGV